MRVFSLLRAFLLAGTVLACDPGQLQHVNSTCSDCQPGTFSIYGNATSCDACSPGFATQYYTATACAACPFGRFAADGGSTSCANCPLGFHSATSSACESCAPGLYAAYSGQFYCSSCPPGRTSAQNATSCFPCTAGTFAATWMSTACADCAIGKFSSESGRTECTDCPSGLVSVAGSTSCSTTAVPTAAPTVSNAPTSSRSPTPAPTARVDVAVGSSRARLPIGIQETYTELVSETLSRTIYVYARLADTDAPSYQLDVRALTDEEVRRAHLNCSSAAGFHATPVVATSGTATSATRFGLVLGSTRWSSTTRAIARCNGGVWKPLSANCIPECKRGPGLTSVVHLYQEGDVDGVTYQDGQAELSNQILAILEAYRSDSRTCLEGRSGCECQYLDDRYQNTRVTWQFVALSVVAAAEVLLDPYGMRLYAATRIFGYQDMNGPTLGFPSVAAFTRMLLQLSIAFTWDRSDLDTGELWLNSEYSSAYIVFILVFIATQLASEIMLSAPPKFLRAWAGAMIVVIGWSAYMLVLFQFSRMTGTRTEAVAAGWIAISSAALFVASSVISFFVSGPRQPIHSFVTASLFPSALAVVLVLTTASTHVACTGGVSPGAVLA